MLSALNSPDPEASRRSDFEEPQGDTGERIVRLCEPVGPEVANRIIHLLLAYETQAAGVPIHMFIFSPGGCVVSGLAIIDVMLHISSPVFTYAIGYAASMGSVILAAGKRGHRYILPHSRVMIHQASGAAGGTMENLRATLAYQTQLEDEVDALLSRFSRRSREEVRAASRVDNWLRAPEAVAFGLADHILSEFPTIL